MKYTVVFKNFKGAVVETITIESERHEELILKIKNYAEQAKLNELSTKLTWEASAVILTGTIEKKEEPKIEEEDDEPYCTECGGIGEDIKYVATYASGDYYRCKCGKGFHH